MLNSDLKIKVCGMKFAANIAGVAALLPDYMGFIFYERSPRFISEVSRELIRYIPPAIKTVGVFVDEDLEEVVKQVNLCQLKAVQLHGQESPEYCAQLKSIFGRIEIIKAFGVDKDFDFKVPEAYSDVADFFLFDTKSRSHGGSGRTFDWSALQQYTGQKPYLLSGGIDPEHFLALKEITDERLYAIDINSKFETEPGLKDVERIKAFQHMLTSDQAVKNRPI